jgi:3-deoxy-D-manno-octulosonate 8-phosphate phosphatase (KDO 8-P phosphatase)
MYKFLVMDVDGTLTDGKIYVGNDGELFKSFDVKDGCGIAVVLPKYGVIPVVITARKSAIVANRCKELNVKECRQGVMNKYEVLCQVLADYSRADGVEYTLRDVAYIGDDLVDLQCMMPVKSAGGLVACPSDAIREVKDISDYICSNRGGDGAVRELIDWMVGNA